jgi:hypothetical protein
MFEILAQFPDLKDTDAAAIEFEFNKWWNTKDYTIDLREPMMIGFAAGWINRPTSDFSY